MLIERNGLRDVNLSCVFLCYQPNFETLSNSVRKKKHPRQVRCILVTYFIHKLTHPLAIPIESLVSKVGFTECCLIRIGLHELSLTESELGFDLNELKTKGNEKSHLKSAFSSDTSLGIKS